MSAMERVTGKEARRVDEVANRILALLQPLMDDGTIVALQLEFLTVVGGKGCVGGYCGESGEAPGALEVMRELLAHGIEFGGNVTRH